MKFGIGYYSLQSPPHNPVPHQQLYSEMLDEVTAADEMGFSSAWLTEHHFVEDGYCPALLVTASAIAARTMNIRIGTGILLMPLHNPVKVAEQAAVVDIISGGRFILGLGLGYRKEEFDDGFGIPLRERKGRMEESIEILLKCWQDGAFSFEGRYYEFENLNVTPKPVQKPIPIWIGAYKEPAIRRVARWGVPLYLASVGTIPILQHEIDMLRGFHEEFGRDSTEIEQPLVRDVYVTPKGKEEGFEDIKKHVTYIYKGYAEWGSMVDAEGDPITDPNDPRLVETVKQQCIFGTPEECIEAIEEFKEAIPLDHLVCRFKFPGLSHEEVMRSMKLFVDKVMPHVA